jgi:small subunit ribosomal protein S16
MKKLGRRHRSFYRVCALDSRVGRGGRVIEELGYYDPMVKDVDARAILNGERIEYWLGVGAKPSDKVSVLIKKYGKDGTHLEKQKAAIERLDAGRRKPPPPPAAAAETESQESAEATESPTSEAAPESEETPESGEGSSEESSE